MKIFKNNYYKFEIYQKDSIFMKIINRSYVYTPHFQSAII